MKLVIVVSVLTLLLAGCAGGDAQSAGGEAEAILVVGDFANPPFSSYDADGNPLGLEVDILAEVGETLGRTVIWEMRPFAEMLPAVEQGEAHIAASTVGITAARAQRVAFSEPYHHTELSVLVRTGDGEPATLQELAGRRVAAGKATTSADAVRTLLPAAELVVERDEDTTFEAMLLGGEIDALALDRPAAERHAAEHAGALLILEESLGDEHYGFAVALEDTELREGIDRVLVQLRDDGRLEAWLERNRGAIATP